MGAAADNFWTLNFYEVYGNVFHTAGSAYGDNKASAYLIVPPGWEGTADDPVGRVRGAGGWRPCCRAAVAVARCCRHAHEGGRGRLTLPCSAPALLLVPCPELPASCWNQHPLLPCRPCSIAWARPSRRYSPPLAHPSSPHPYPPPPRATRCSAPPPWRPTCWAAPSWWATPPPSPSSTWAGRCRRRAPSRRWGFNTGRAGGYLGCVERP